MKTAQNEKFARQPAIRLFAAELAESKQTIIEHVEGRDFDSRYQLTPTGIKVKRVLMMGALVEVDNVGTSEDYLRGRIIDPTGAFNVYAGHYQPEALLSLSNIAIPCFVAVIGKTNAYRPDEETTIISIRPETIVEIDAKTRDHWIKETVTMTLERVGRSQLPEEEKEKYRQMCKDALTKLVYMPQGTSMQIHEPREPVPQQEENIPAKSIIELALKDSGNQPDDSELEESISYPMTEANSNMPSSNIPSSNIPSNDVPQKAASYTELADTAKDIIDIEENTAIELIKDYEDKDNTDKNLFTLPALRVEELPEPENKISKTQHVQESKESKTKSNDSIKTRVRKKKIKKEPVNNSQKTLFTEA